MAENLRVAVEADLQDSEDDWGLPIELTDPDGNKQIYKAGSTSEKLKSLQILYNTRVFNPDTGDEKVVPVKMVSVRISSLDRVPQPGENWHVRIPGKPDPDAAMIDLVLTATRPTEDGSGLGHVRLYPQKAEQS